MAPPDAISAAYPYPTQSVDMLDTCRQKYRVWIMSLSKYWIHQVSPRGSTRLKRCTKNTYRTARVLQHRIITENYLWQQKIQNHCSIRKMSTLSRHPCVWRQIAEGCVCLSHQIMLTDSRSTNTLRTHAKYCLMARAGLTGYNKCGLCRILQEMRKIKAYRPQRVTYKKK